MHHIKPNKSDFIITIDTIELILLRMCETRNWNKIQLFLCLHVRAFYYHDNFLHQFSNRWNKRK